MICALLLGVACEQGGQTTTGQAGNSPKRQPAKAATQTPANQPNSKNLKNKDLKKPGKQHNSSNKTAPTDQFTQDCLIAIRQIKTSQADFAAAKQRLKAYFANSADIEMRLRKALNHQHGAPRYLALQFMYQELPTQKYPKFLPELVRALESENKSLRSASLRLLLLTKLDANATGPLATKLLAQLKQLNRGNAAMILNLLTNLRESVKISETQALNDILPLLLHPHVAIRSHALVCLQTHFGTALTEKLRAKLKSTLTSHLPNMSAPLQELIYLAQAIGDIDPTLISTADLNTGFQRIRPNQNSKSSPNMNPKLIFALLANTELTNLKQCQTELISLFKTGELPVKEAVVAALVKLQVPELSEFYRSSVASLQTTMTNALALELIQQRQSSSAELNGNALSANHTALFQAIVETALKSSRLPSPEFTAIFGERLFETLAIQASTQVSTTMTEKPEAVLEFLAYLLKCQAQRKSGAKLIFDSSHCLSLLQNTAFTAKLQEVHFRRLCRLLIEGQPALSKQIPEDFRQRLQAKYQTENSGLEALVWGVKSESLQVALIRRFSKLTPKQLNSAEASRQLNWLAAQQLSSKAVKELVGVKVTACPFKFWLEVIQNNRKLFKAHKSWVLLNFAPANQQAWASTTGVYRVRILACFLGQWPEVKVKLFALSRHPLAHIRRLVLAELSKQPSKPLSTLMLNSLTAGNVAEKCLALDYFATADFPAERLASLVGLCESRNEVVQKKARERLTAICSKLDKNAVPEAYKKAAQSRLDQLLREPTMAGYQTLRCFGTVLYSLELQQVCASLLKEHKATVTQSKTPLMMPLIVDRLVIALSLRAQQKLENLETLTQLRWRSSAIGFAAFLDFCGQTSRKSEFRELMKSVSDLRHSHMIALLDFLIQRQDWASLAECLQHSSPACQVYLLQQLAKRNNLEGADGLTKTLAQLAAQPIISALSVKAFEVETRISTTDLQPAVEALLKSKQGKSIEILLTTLRQEGRLSVPLQSLIAKWLSRNPRFTSVFLKAL